MADRSVARVVAIVQARMSSSRFPGKALVELGGMPAIELLLRRLERAEEPDGLLLATSVEASDDPLVAAVEQLGVEAFRGPLDDVLERYRLAAQGAEAEAVVRITGDCPLIDPAVVDRVVARWRSGAEDYVANVLEPRSDPDGVDVEVISTACLELAATEATDRGDREHVTIFIRANPERFSQAAVSALTRATGVRLDLDTPADLDFLRRLVDAAGPWASLEKLLDVAGSLR